LSHKAWKSAQRFDLGACPRKKDRTVHNRTGQSKMSQRRYNSPTWGEAPTEPILTEICTMHNSCRPRRNHVCKLLNWNFQGLGF